MYYASFVLDDRQFLIQKLEEIANNGAREAYLYRNGPRGILSSAILPDAIGRDFYPDFWFIHGAQKPAAAGSQDFDLTLYARTSLRDINNLFDRFANGFSWTLFPWGGRSSYGLLVFVSSDESLSVRFHMNPMSNAEAAEDPRDHSALIVSHYEVESVIEGVFRGIIFEEERYRAGLAVWNACCCSGVRPYVVFYEYNKEVLSASILESSFEVLRTFSLDSDPLTLLSVYRPNDVKSYCAMLNDHGSIPDTLVVVPGTTDLDTVCSLLDRTESNITGSDLQNVQILLETVPWYYALGRNHQDWPYSLFVAQDSGLVERVATQEDKIDLIACL